MFAVIFKAEINTLDSAYTETVSRMRELATDRYGCRDFVSVSEGSHEITISYWESEAQIVAWRQDAEHLLAQEKGRSRWYKSYVVEVVRIEREYRYNS